MTLKNVSNQYFEWSKKSAFKVAKVVQHMPGTKWNKIIKLTAHTIIKPRTRSYQAYYLNVYLSYMQT